MKNVKETFGKVVRKVNNSPLNKNSVSSRALKLKNIAPKSFDYAWYFKTYDDLASCGSNLLEHYLEYGWKEGRIPNPLFDVDWYKKQFMDCEDTAISPLEHYVYLGSKSEAPFNLLIDPKFIIEHYNLSHGANLLEFFSSNNGNIDYISEWFSRKEYILQNQDVSSSNVIPEMHFLRHGLNELRKPAVDLHLEIMGSRFRNIAHENNKNIRIVGEIKFNDINYCIVKQRISDNVYKQIMEQSQFDVDLISLGYKALPYIRQFVGNDIDTRNLINYRQLLDCFPPNTDAIILVSRLQLGGAEKYAANLAYGLESAGIKNVVIATTEALESDDKNYRNLEIFKKIPHVRVVSIFDHVKDSWNKEMILSLLLLRSRAKFIFVINSDLGIKTLAKYGKALSNNAKLFCSFFSESPFVQGAPYSAVYLKDVIMHSWIITDNNHYVETVKKRLAKSMHSKLIVLPSLIDLPNSKNFEARLRDRKTRHLKNRYSNMLWYSRWEKFKATDVLIGILESRKDYLVDGFGSLDASYNKELVPKNFEHLGFCNNLYGLDLGRYSAFLFTSYFEGMPNSVLEMAMLGVPIVASDVGGIADTFQNGEVELINMEQPLDKIISDFILAIDKINAEDWGKLEARIVAAREAVMHKHGYKAFIEKINQILEQ